MDLCMALECRTGCTKAAHFPGLRTRTSRCDLCWRLHHADTGHSCLLEWQVHWDLSGINPFETIAKTLDWQAWDWSARVWHNLGWPAAILIVYYSAKMVCHLELLQSSTTCDLMEQLRLLGFVRYLGFQNERWCCMGFYGAGFATSGQNFGSSSAPDHYLLRSSRLRSPECLLIHGLQNTQWLQWHLLQNRWNSDSIGSSGIRVLVFGMNLEPGSEPQQNGSRLHMCWLGQYSWSSMQLFFPEHFCWN